MKAMVLFIKKIQKYLFFEKPNYKKQNQNKMSFSGSANSEYFLVKI